MRLRLSRLCSLALALLLAAASSTPLHAEAVKTTLRQVDGKWELIRDGKPYVPVVNRTHSLCLQHYNRYRTELNGSFNRKGGPKALARKKPRLHFAGDEGVTTKTKRVPKTIGIRGVDDE